MYQNILLVYNCEEKFETVIQELNKLTGQSSMEENVTKTLITILVIVPQRKLKHSVICYDKHFDELVKEEKIKLKPFFNDLSLNRFNYETKFICGGVKRKALEEIETHKYGIAILCNRKLKLKWKDALGDIARRITKKRRSLYFLLNS
ncbi:hypothetical protein QI298_10655 [Staphylococcus saprophyticus]|nr:hypothetical protein [Staphylococcus saprophyticus]